MEGGAEKCGGRFFASLRMTFVVLLLRMMLVVLLPRMMIAVLELRMSFIESLTKMATP